MCNKLIYLMTFVFVLGIVSSASAYDLWWIEGEQYSADGRWDQYQGTVNGHGWLTSKDGTAGRDIPTIEDQVSIDSYGHSLEVDSTMVGYTRAVCDTLVVGDYMENVLPSYLNITGGELMADGREFEMLGGGTRNIGAIIGKWGDANPLHGSDGYMTIYDGSNVLIGGEMWVKHAGNGTLRMYGGFLGVSEALLIGASEMYPFDENDILRDTTGHVQLDGGVISTLRLEMNAKGSMDITAGELILDGDVSELIQWYVNNGWITGYGGVGEVIIEVKANHTHVTAIPEPATIVLLGLGGLALLRRRRGYGV